MTAFFELLAGIGDAIIGMIDFAISMVQDLIYAVGLFVQLTPAIPVFWIWLPAGFVAVLGVIISIAIIFRVLGWSS